MELYHFPGNKAPLPIVVEDLLNAYKKAPYTELVIAYDPKTDEATIYDIVYPASLPEWQDNYRRYYNKRQALLSAGNYGRFLLISDGKAYLFDTSAEAAHYRIQFRDPASIIIQIGREYNKLSM